MNYEETFKINHWFTWFNNQFRNYEYRYRSFMIVFNQSGCFRLYKSCQINKPDFFFTKMCSKTSKKSWKCSFEIGCWIRRARYKNRSFGYQKYSWLKKSLDIDKWICTANFVCQLIHIRNQIFSLYVILIEFLNIT